MWPWYSRGRAGRDTVSTHRFLRRSLALPEEAARVALRTEQIIAYESGVAQTVDPLGGSYFLETLTLQMENGAFDYFSKMDAMGGMVKAIERGYPQKEIAEASYQYQRAVEAKEKIIVGVNEFAIEEEPPHTSTSVARQQAMKRRCAPTFERQRPAPWMRLESRCIRPKAGSNGMYLSANTMPHIVEAKPRHWQTQSCAGA